MPPTEAIYRKEVAQYVVDHMPNDFSMLTSLVEQVGMSPGTLKAYLVARNLVDQQPIRLDVRITETTPATFQWVVELGHW